MQQNGAEIIDRPPLIPPGEYLLKLDSWSTAMMWGRSPKLIMTFIVVSVGNYFGLKIQRYYNVDRLIGKPGKSGQFKLRWSSDAVREYATLIHAPSRLDRVYLEHYSRLVIVGRVKTVEKTSLQKNLPEALRYSVIEELLRVEAGHT